MNLLDRFERMIEHPEFCEVVVWSYHPKAYDMAVSIGQDLSGSWRWYDDEGGVMLNDSPAFDSLLDAFEELTELTAKPAV